jgi:hypothetical protein
MKYISVKSTYKAALKNLNQILTLASLIAGSLSFAVPSWADEWDNHEETFVQKFESERGLIASPLLGYGQTEEDGDDMDQEFDALNLKKTLTLNADRINIMIGAFAEIDFKVAELKIMPYVEFRLDKQKPKL